MGKVLHWEFQKQIEQRAEQDNIISSFLDGKLTFEDAKRQMDRILNADNYEAGFQAGKLEKQSVYFMAGCLLTFFLCAFMVWYLNVVDAGHMRALAECRQFVRDN